MKQLYLFALCLFFASVVFSQQKFELGFAIKTGTFTLPHERQTKQLTTTYTYPAGFSSSFGVFASRRLGGHFRLSLDLLYNLSKYKEIRNGIDYASSFYPTPLEKTTLSINAHSFIAPLQVHYLPKKDGKISLNAGVALNYVLSSDMYARFEKSTQQSTTGKLDDPVKWISGDAVFQTLFTAGAHYRIGTETALGLEFMGLLHHRTPFIFLPRHSHLTDNGATPFWMQSLAISLRHNILR